VRQRNHAVFFEPRLGKTKVGIDWSNILALKGEVKRCVILAPSIALPVWQDELVKHCTLHAHVEDYTHEWSLPGGAGAPQIQYFLAGREATFRRTRDSTGTLLPGKKEKILEDWRPDAIILDESHEYKRPGGRSSQDGWHLIRRLRKSDKHTPARPYVLLLTGTPSAKGWRDLFAQYRLMDDTILGTSASDFDEEYCVYGSGPRKFTVIRYKNLPRLQRKIAAHCTTATAEQVGLSGILNFQVIPYQLPPQIRRLYDELSEDFVATLSGDEAITAANAGVKRLRLLQITSGFITDPDRRQIHSVEERAAKDWLALVCQQGENIVVYCRFTAEVDAIARVSRAAGFQAVVIDGRTHHQDRTKAIRAFQDQRKGGKPKALVFQYQAGSRAIELTAAAEVLFTSLPDGWVDFWQALNRVRGPNQHRPVRITALCATGTVDYSVLRALRAKEDVHRSLLKDPTRFLSGLPPL